MSQTAEQSRSQPAFSIRLAGSGREIEQALRLRYEVFAEEERNSALYNESGLERDEYDAYCDHLLVEDLSTGQIAGTYRLLPGERAQKHIGFYSETEFDLSGFEDKKSRSLELGRSCVAKEYRSGKVIQLLWEGIAEYINQREIDYLIGCASIHMNSLQELNEIYSMLRGSGALTDKYGIRPLDTHRIEGLQMLELQLEQRQVFRRLPPLMKGYQWLGAEIGGEPAYDPVFNTVDFFIILDKSKLTAKYRRHFLDA